MLKNNRAAFTGAGVALGLAMLLSPAPNAQAATFSYNGTTAGASTWNRPNETPTSLSGTTVSYSSQAFTVNANDNYSFTSVAPWDNYTFLYQGSFNPSTPLINAVKGNDNLIASFSGLNFSGFSANLTTGTNYFFVTTGNGSTSTGTFSNAINGTNTNSLASAGSISSVPEPATVLGSIVAFGYSVHSRRKQKNAAAQSNETV
jgi:hypothetical protein